MRYNTFFSGSERSIPRGPTPRRYDMDIDVRVVYESLHAIMEEGLRKNGFVREYEAISFVSSLFSHVMASEFTRKYLAMFRKNYQERDNDTFTTEIKVMISSLIHAVMADANGAGVSPTYMEKFFKETAAKSIRDFTKSLASRPVPMYPTEEEYLEGSLNDLYKFMKESMLAAKDTDYPRKLSAVFFSDTPHYLVFIVAILLCLSFLAVL